VLDERGSPSQVKGAGDMEALVKGKQAMLSRLIYGCGSVVDFRRVSAWLSLRGSSTSTRSRTKLPSWTEEEAKAIINVCFKVDDSVIYPRIIHFAQNLGGLPQEAVLPPKHRIGKE